MTKAKSKINWRQPHKVVVHPNRWLLWAISVIALVCASLIAYIQISGIHFQNQMETTDTPGSSWAIFRHKTAGYTLNYPRAWALETEGESISFVNIQNIEEFFSVTVYPASEEFEVRQSLFNTEEDEIFISGHKAFKITQSKIEPDSVVLVRDGNKLYVMRGRGNYFNRIAESFIFTQKIE